MKTDFYIELNEQQTDYRQLIDTAKEIWKAEGNKVKDLQTLQLYFKPDESACYYIMNEECRGHFAI
ncbi:MAG: DUF6465 family protein [Clostridiales bacterium]|jgi:hypothetical protein|nr:DUF6465 family protein [Clostridiales bacterium]